MKFFAPGKLGKKQALTPEGFLLCEDVPIARTGTMLYADGEVPVEAGRDGLIRVERDEGEVFRPETIASYAGKPVTDDHPDDGVTPENWRQLAVGTVQNVRRGEGVLDDLLLADLLITDAAAIEAVRDGKREVSCGYDADYEQIEPGRGRQLNIIGNHVALVERGRCGSRCAIGDKDMAKKTWKDRLREAFKSKDEKAMEEALAEAKDEEGEPQKLVIEVKTPEAVGGDEKPEPKEAKDEDPVAALTAQVAALTEMVKKLAGAEAAEVKDGEGEEATEDGEPEEGEEPKKTGDGLRRDFQDTIARAELLAPGFKVSTLDAKADPKKAKDSLCACKRKALDAAYSGAHRERLKPLLAGRALDKMDCRTLDALFVGASEIVKAANNAAGVRGAVSTKDFGRTVTADDINKKNADVWAKRLGTVK